ncbi:MAG: queuosine precursor transporter [Phycisphaerales bacterium]|nr:queuosine precursor transporter [Phycisphaerales bacterium]
MANELIFVIHFLVSGALLLGAARLGRVWLTALIVTCTILMNMAVTKQMQLFTLNVTGGNVLFATVFLANDVLNEHYGRKAARTAVMIGFASGLAVIVLMVPMLQYLPSRSDDAQRHLEYFFNVATYPRIVIASMLSYVLSQMMDAHLYDFIHHRTGTKRLLWLRSNASTWISQAFDTVFFTTVGLTGSASVIRSWPEWVDAVLFAYLIKIIVAAADTPFLYLTTSKMLCPRDSRRAESSLRKGLAR